MLLTKQNIDIWYSVYEKQYETTKKYITSRKGSYRDIGMMSRDDFETDFRAMVGDNPALGGTAIAKKMAKQDLYTTSFAQGKRLAEAHADVFGGNVNIHMIQSYRLGLNSDIFNIIQTVRKDMKSQGFSNEAIAILISQQFFGSE